MPIPIYLALTPAEFLSCEALPHKSAWMACHFSACGKGLSTIPDTLPRGSLLILDDSTPYQGHDPDLILSQLSDAVSAIKPDALLLDLQRPNTEQVQSLALTLIRQLPCPVIVSSCYADSLDCPIFLPPGPLCQPLAEYLKPYRGRDIWLDAAPVCAQLWVTAEGTQYLPQPNGTLSETVHFDEALHCRYGMKVDENRITFTLARTCSDLPGWLAEAEALGVSGAVGLYREMIDICVDGN